MGGSPEGLGLFEGVRTDEGDEGGVGWGVNAPFLLPPPPYVWPKPTRLQRFGDSQKESKDGTLRSC